MQGPPESGGKEGDAAGALPEPPTPFVGREEELAEIAGLLADPACRLLTLVGPGGIGKTRLALAAAARAGTAFPWGARFVALQPLDSPDLLVPALADAVGLSRGGAADSRERLLAFLRERPALLVLDNFEHLLEGAALLAGLLRAPGAKALVTSRQALRLREEWLYPVQGLPYPPEKARGPGEPGDDLERFGAVRLFAACARRVRRDFSLEAELEGTARLCRLVEGMPLALELAAAWAGALPSADIAAELERGLDVLAGGPRDAPQRHLSVRAAFDGSWQRLTPEERAVFRRLAVFRGGFRREAAARVAGATTLALAALVERSLLRLDRDGRYRVHELLRQYGEERLREAPEEAVAVEAEHGAYFTGWVQDLLPRLLGAGQREALATLGADRDNVRTAWQWAVAQADAAALARAAPGIAELSLWEGRFQEGASAFEQAAQTLQGMLEAQGEDAPGEAGPAAALALVLSQLSRCYIRLGRQEEAEATLIRCRALRAGLDGPPALGVATDPDLSLCHIATIRGDYELALRLAETALAAAEAWGHVPNQQFAWDLRARAAMHLGRLEEAQRYAERAQALVETSGDRIAEASVLTVMGSVALIREDYRLARSCFESNLTIRESLGGRGALALAWNKLGQVALREGHPAEARRFFERGRAAGTAHGDPGGLTDALIGLGLSATALGEYGAAREHLRAALATAAGRTFGIYLASLLLGTGELALRAGDPQGGRELLALTLQHPAAPHDVRERALRLLRDGQPDGAPSGALPPVGPTGGDQDLAARMLGVLVGLRVEDPPAPPPPAGGQGAPAVPPAREQGAPAAPPARGQGAPAAPALAEPLTERELEVLRLAAEGLSNRQIAMRLYIALGTTKAHLHSILGKLEAPNRVAAIARARALGLL
jgi:predicted ATPase/DNA-binding CsgD family transcriptional regulator